MIGIIQRLCSKNNFRRALCAIAHLGLVGMTFIESMNVRAFCLFVILVADFLCLGITYSQIKQDTTPEIENDYDTGDEESHVSDVHQENTRRNILRMFIFSYFLMSALLIMIFHMPMWIRIVFFVMIESKTAIDIMLDYRNHRRF